jgi:predicted anti-sigma-YlaC factor YlaD
MYQCKDVTDEVNNYIDGDLPLGKRIGLFLHLLMCSCCRNYLQQVRSTISIITVAHPKEHDGTDINALAKQLHSLCHHEGDEHH